MIGRGNYWEAKWKTALVSTYVLVEFKTRPRRIIITTNVAIVRNFDSYIFGKAMRRRIRGILMSGKQFSLDSRMDLVQGHGMVPTASKKAICVSSESTKDPSEDDSSKTQRYTIWRIIIVFLFFVRRSEVLYGIHFTRDSFLVFRLKYLS